MRLAQQLYEGIEIKGNGVVGIITYLRTDSTRVSKEAEVMAEEYIRANYGDEYVVKAAAAPKNDKKIQDAHEAIRPTDLSRTPPCRYEGFSLQGPAPALPVDLETFYCQQDAGGEI